MKVGQLVCNANERAGLWRVGKQRGSIDWFQYRALSSKKDFLNNLSESFIKNLCIKICNSSNALQFFHIPPNNVSGIL